MFRVQLLIELLQISPAEAPSTNLEANSGDWETWPWPQNGAPHRVLTVPSQEVSKA